MSLGSTVPKPALPAPELAVHPPSSGHRFRKTPLRSRVAEVGQVSSTGRSTWLTSFVHTLTSRPTELLSFCRSKVSSCFPLESAFRRNSGRSRGDHGDHGPKPRRPASNDVAPTEADPGVGRPAKWFRPGPGAAGHWSRLSSDWTDGCRTESNIKHGSHGS